MRDDGAGTVAVSPPGQQATKERPPRGRLRVLVKQKPCEGRAEVKASPCQWVDP
jgi:hypothetical protein